MKSAQSRRTVLTSPSEQRPTRSKEDIALFSFICCAADKHDISSVLLLYMKINMMNKTFKVLAI